jgi:hypothetical protein
VATCEPKHPKLVERDLDGLGSERRGFKKERPGEDRSAERHAPATASAPGREELATRKAPGPPVRKAFSSWGPLDDVGADTNCLERGLS